MAARIIGRIADVLVGHCQQSNGRAIVVAFHLSRRVWQAKERGSTIHYESARLRDAVADAAGDDPDASWIRTLEAEITAASGMASESPTPDG